MLGSRQMADCVPVMSGIDRRCKRKMSPRRRPLDRCQGATTRRPRLGWSHAFGSLPRITAMSVRNPQAVFPASLCGTLRANCTQTARKDRRFTPGSVLDPPPGPSFETQLRRRYPEKKLPLMFAPRAQSARPIRIRCKGSCNWLVSQIPVHAPNQSYMSPPPSMGPTR